MTACPESTNKLPSWFITFAVSAAMFALTSLFSAVWFASALDARVMMLEAEAAMNKGLPARITVLENRMQDMTTILTEIRDELRKPN